MLLFQHFVYTMECNEIINGKIPWAMFYYNAMFENVCFGYAMVVYIIHFSARNRISSLACNRSNIYTCMYQIDVVYIRNKLMRERTISGVSYFFFACVGDFAALFLIQCRLALKLSAPTIFRC